MQAPPGRVVCFGEAMLRNSNGSITPGGAEYNVACALARLGVSASWVSVVPEETTMVENTARECGVHLDVRRSNFPIGTYAVDQMAKTVEYNRSNSAFAQLNPDDFDWRGILTGARWLITVSYTHLTLPTIYSV